MKVNNRITELFKIKYPIIQGGMVWVSGWKLASAVSKNGGLGLVGAGSMKPDLLREHIQKCKNATAYNFGVNLPLLRQDANDLIDVIIDEHVPIVFTSAGHPGKFIDKLKQENIINVHVVSNIKQAIKAESVGCDAIVGEGVEAGGHNGKDEITTFCLIPQLLKNVSIPVIAAGGIATGSGILAAISLGAEGVQIGTRFAASIESSAHLNYKESLIKATNEDTILILRKIGLTRLIKNNWALLIQKAENEGVDENELKVLLGEKRERAGIFEGDIDNGMLEAGQSVGLIQNIDTVENIMVSLVQEFDEQLGKINSLFN